MIRVEPCTEHAADIRLAELISDYFDIGTDACMAYRIVKVVMM